MKKKVPRRVWYIHHAESEGLYKTYDKRLLANVEREQADIISRETYEIWMKRYGYKEESILERV